MRKAIAAMSIASMVFMASASGAWAVNGSWWDITCVPGSKHWPSCDCVTNSEDGGTGIGSGITG